MNPIVELDPNSLRKMANSADGPGIGERRDTSRDRRDDERRAGPQNRREKVERRVDDSPGIAAAPQTEERRDVDRRNPNRPLQEQRMAGIGEIIPDRRARQRRERTRR